MRLRFGLSLLFAMLLCAGSATAQPLPSRGPADPRSPAGGPNQPVSPQIPTLERRYPPPESPPSPPTFAAPAQLTAQEQAEVDQILQVWEQRSAGVKTFECDFTRFEYDPVFGPPDQPRFVDTGSIKYAAPDKGAYKVDGERAEQWICDGKSIYEYNYAKKQMIERKLPPELQGRAIANGPLPFLFGAKAQQLKQRYFIKVITPPENRAQETWLRADPRYAQDAANFKYAELILANKDMTPTAIRLHSPNGKNSTSFSFTGIVTNDPLRFFKGDPFRATTPLGWQKIVEQAPTAQAARVSPPGSR